MNKATGYVIGIILIVVGVILAFYGFFSFISLPSSLSKGFGDNMDFGAAANAQAGAFASGAVGILMIFIGMVFAIAGGFLIYFISIGKIAYFVASETAPAVEVGLHALGKGLARGIRKGWHEAAPKRKRKK